MWLWFVVFGVVTVMLHLRLDKVTEARLNKLCKATCHSKNYYMEKAIIEFLDYNEDYSRAISVLQKKEPMISLTELKQRLDSMSESS